MCIIEFWALKKELLPLFFYGEVMPALGFATQFNLYPLSTTIVLLLMDPSS